MKKLFFFPVLILFLIACEGEDEPTPPNNENEDYIIAKVDGETKDFEFPQSLLVPDLFTIDLFTIAGVYIESNDTNSLAIVFTMPIGKALEETSYQYIDSSCTENQLEEERACATIAYGILENEALPFSSGFDDGNATISFSSLNYESGGRAVGTFSGTLYDEDENSISITDGEFSVLIE